MSPLNVVLLPHIRQSGAHTFRVHPVARDIKHTADKAVAGSNIAFSMGICANFVQAMYELAERKPDFLVCDFDTSLSVPDSVWKTLVEESTGERATPVILIARSGAIASSFKDWVPNSFVSTALKEAYDKSVVASINIPAQYNVELWKDLIATMAEYKKRKADKTPLRTRFKKAFDAVVPAGKTYPKGEGVLSLDL